MMEMAKVTSKGQITIPISIRRRLGINEGDKLLFIDKPDGVMMVNPDMLGEDPTDYAVMTAEATTPDPAVAAMKKKVASVDPAPAVAAETAEITQEDTIDDVLADEPDPAATAPSPVPPPVEESEVPVKPAKSEESDKQVGGLDLSSLLDDIRSIGSNI